MSSIPLGKFIQVMNNLKLSELTHEISCEHFLSNIYLNLEQVNLISGDPWKFVRGEFKNMPLMLETASESYQLFDFEYICGFDQDYLLRKGAIMKRAARSDRTTYDRTRGNIEDAGDCLELLFQSGFLTEEEFKRGINDYVISCAGPEYFSQEVRNQLASRINQLYRVRFGFSSLLPEEEEFLSRIDQKEITAEEFAQSVFLELKRNKTPWKVEGKQWKFKEGKFVNMEAVLNAAPRYYAIYGLESCPGLNHDYLIKRSLIDQGDGLSSHAANDITAYNQLLDASGAHLYHHFGDSFNSLQEKDFLAEIKVYVERAAGNQVNPVRKYRLVDDIHQRHRKAFGFGGELPEDPHSISLALKSLKLILGPF